MPRIPMVEMLIIVAGYIVAVAGNEYSTNPMTNWYPNVQQMSMSEIQRTQSTTMTDDAFLSEAATHQPIKF